MTKIIRAIGRRKSAVAQVKLSTGDGNMMINKKTITDYLQSNPVLISRIQTTLDTLDSPTTYDIEVQVSGGGITGQAEAIQLGIARALAGIDSSFRTVLKPKGFLTRDSRVKERRKYGLKKARKAPQFSKR
uniref:Small ribosomal subunit protein uS9c n=1 Tax=Marsupiomonas sp. NIES 1824 TaxID=1562198 RepID=A0A097KM01_9CHLO|nr:ribosomal protein S9 [Marsupiomonas sp. NIES 1824]